MAVKTSAIAATAQATCFSKAPVSLLAATFVSKSIPFIAVIGGAQGQVIASPNLGSLQWTAQKRYDAGERDKKVEIRRIDVHGQVPASAPTF